MAKTPSSSAILPMKTEGGEMFVLLYAMLSLVMVIAAAIIWQESYEKMALNPVPVLAEIANMER
jgi:hypothetical protein